MKGNQKGFTAVEGLLILVIVGLIGFVGWFVYDSKNKSESNYNSAASTATNSVAKSTNKYAGWNSYTLKYEKLSFKYPSSWQVKDQSQNNSDSVILTGPNNFSVLITTGGLGHPSLDYEPAILAADAVKFAGTSAYLDYIGGIPSAPKDMVYQAVLSKSKTDSLDSLSSKAVGQNSGSGGNLGISIYYADSSGEYTGKTLTVVKADQNYSDAKNLLESASY